MGFTPAELAEMARADAEIEADFCMTNEEIAFGRILDRDFTLENMDRQSRKIAEAQRQYYAANKDKIAEAQRQYRAANKDKIAEGKRAIHDLRKSLRLSQKKFGALCGVSQPTVWYWENIAEPENWREICEAHGRRGDAHAAP